MRNRRKSPAGITHPAASIAQGSGIETRTFGASTRPAHTWKRSRDCSRFSSGGTKDDQQLALAWIQHPDGRSEPRLLRRRCSGRTESWIYGRRQPRGRVCRIAACWPRPSPAIAATPLVTLRQFHSNLVVMPAAADANARASAEGRRSDHRRAGIAACDSNRRLHSGAGCGPQAARCGGLPRRLAGNGEAHCRNGRRAHAARVRLTPPRPGRGHWTRESAPCCYAVGEEVLSDFESQFSYARELFREVFDADPVRTKYPMLFLPSARRGIRPSAPPASGSD